VRILLSALRCEKGALDFNLAEHRRVLAEARDAGCALAVFPEMSLTGSVDPTRHPERLIRLDDPAVAAMAALTAELGVAAVFGLSEVSVGGVASITQAFAHSGRLAGVQRKRHLGDDEIGYRPADEDAVFELDHLRFTIAICAEGETDRPFSHAQAVGADLVCFAAAPGLYGRRTTEDEWQLGWDWWCGHGLGQARHHARARGLWIALAGQAGSTVDEDFPGLAALVDRHGDVVAQLPDWQAGNLVVDVPEPSGRTDRPSSATPKLPA
jgi:predicted amidohydrolase